MKSATTSPLDLGCAGEARPLRVLVLGGTSEARALAARIAQRPTIQAVMSLAGRTSAPLDVGLPTRIGGFGGADGLARYLAQTKIDRVIDATHPFASRISANARSACAALSIPLASFGREPWRAQEGDRWIEAGDLGEAAAALAGAPKRVFLTIGRLGVGAFRAQPQHEYLIRTIEPPELAELPPRSALLFSRGPFAKDDEIALMREQRVELVVTKNSGGPSTYAKMEAARELGLEAVVISPPAYPEVSRLGDLDAAMAFLS
ncbi:cobalt-precorrin-6A reductase [Methylocystis heyeri]|uniref:Cobalt-precorrin-6A reductase n=1 Tax=Methylocystis heyeri TaxID=391905 RepID=A0A6B8KDH3_9HYPH|nr:cobalt-precorrin-6A reductase [Methylocystis heyeri]QGM44598.1 cobalt-precorrin-6A reductase [Methylocystis heyeri]